MTTPTPTKRPHGGKRPGAGAPKGNLNALRSGAYSSRAQLAGLILTAYPELRAVLRSEAIREANQRTARRQNAVRVAYQAVMDDPDLAQTIKALVKDSLRRRLAQIQSNQTEQKPEKFNQTIKREVAAANPGQ